MSKPRCTLITLTLLCVCVAARPATPVARAPEPIVYKISFPSLDKHIAEIEVSVPTEGKASIDVMMPVWSPGFYRIENYADRVSSFTARSSDGTKLEVERPRKNRWRIQTQGAAEVLLTYRLQCNSKFVTGNWVGEDYTVLNGPSAFITLVETAHRPHEVKLELPEKWKQSATGLASHADGKPHHYQAADYDALADSPIVAGTLAISDFDVEGSKHYLVAFGDISKWDNAKVAVDLEKIVRAQRSFWGELPFQKYVFFFSVTQGGGGLEHRNSTLVSASPSNAQPGRSNLSWLSMICHEYFHAFNVKRLRPVELGPFDYEKETHTSGLWVAEGLTTYYGELLMPRAGLATRDDILGNLTGKITQLQNNPGRLIQTLEQSSLDVWTSSYSGVGQSPKTVSYYVKGPVVGFLLDARIRKATDGAKSLDDVMRLAYQRYGGEKGFTADQFRETAEQVSGIDLKDWLHRAISSTEELDYAEALEWFGLEFTTPDPKKPDRKWKLVQRADASEAQKNHLNAWLNSTDK